MTSQHPPGPPPPVGVFVCVCCPPAPCLQAELAMWSCRCVWISPSSLPLAPFHSWYCRQYTLQMDKLKPPERKCLCCSLNWGEQNNTGKDVVWLSISYACLLKQQFFFLSDVVGSSEVNHFVVLLPALKMTLKTSQFPRPAFGEHVWVFQHQPVQPLFSTARVQILDRLEERSGLFELIAVA